MGLFSHYPISQDLTDAHILEQSGEVPNQREVGVMEIAKKESPNILCLSKF